MTIRNITANGAKRCTQVKRRGIKNIVSIVTDENENSKIFHEKHGFILEGHIKNFAEKFEKTLGVYYFRKTL